MNVLDYECEPDVEIQEEKTMEEEEEMVDEGMSVQVMDVDEDFDEVVEMADFLILIAIFDNFLF